MPESTLNKRVHSPEFALLGFLYGGPNHGYTLHQQLETELGHVWHVSQSHTYAILKRLETQGFISSTTLEQEKLPARQLLHITPAGRKRFIAWLQTASGSSVRAIRLEFITRLYFAQKLFPKKVGSIFSAQLKEVETALKHLRKDQAGIPADQTFNQMGLDLRILQLDSIRAWLMECRQSFGVRD